VIGIDADGDGTGEPVPRHKKPNVGKSFRIATPQDSDEFSGIRLGPQWQWPANPGASWAFPFPQKGVLRMLSVETPGYKNLWDLPNLLLQKFPAEEFTATAKIELTPRFEGEKFGLVVMGMDYSYLGVTNHGGRLYVAQSTALDADRGNPEKEVTSPLLLDTNEFYLRVNVIKDSMCTFSFSIDGKSFKNIGRPFKAREGRWIGAKVGFFFSRPAKFNDAGSADIDWFRFEK
jgi:beta-xylosidase